MTGDRLCLETIEAATWRFGPETRRDDEATQALRVVEKEQRSIRPKDPASRRVGPEMALLLRPRPLRDSYGLSRVGSASSHQGHFRPNAVLNSFQTEPGRVADSPLLLDVVLDLLHAHGVAGGEMGLQELRERQMIGCEPIPSVRKFYLVGLRLLLLRSDG
jgi:hypothetical protein